MRYGLMILGLLVTTAAGQDQPPAEATAVLTRAAKALGGADKLSQYQAVTWKGKGTLRALGGTILFDGDVTSQGVDCHRFDLALGANQETPFLLVLAGDQGWVKAGDKTLPLPDQLAPVRADTYAATLAMRPHLLTGKEYTLAALGEVQIDGRPAVGVRVGRKGWPDVNLFYDRDSGLPIKGEVRVTDPGTAREVNDECFLSEYREFNGLKHYTKLVWKRDGADYVDREMTDVRWHERLDDALFARP
jgi:hypothetical protein